MLQNNLGNDRAISANGSFTFLTSLFNGADYAVTVQTQPTNPSQTCTVSNGSGTLAGANVTNVSVTCTTNTYSIGGNVSGLAGSGLVLQNNLGNDRAISANGSFTFTTPLADGTGYSVTVKTQPTSPAQNCSVSDGSGVLAGSNINSAKIACLIKPEGIFADGFEDQDP